MLATYFLHLSWHEIYICIPFSTLFLAQKICSKIWAYFYIAYQNIIKFLTEKDDQKYMNKIVYISYINFVCLICILYIVGSIFSKKLPIPVFCVFGLKTKKRLMQIHTNNHLLNKVLSGAAKGLSSSTLHAYVLLSKLSLLPYVGLRWRQPLSYSSV